MGARSSSLVGRSLRHSLRLCPSSRGSRGSRGSRAKAAEDSRGPGLSGHPLGPLEELGALGGPVGAFVMPLENPPDVIEAHERYYSHHNHHYHHHNHNHQAAGRYSYFSPCSPRPALTPIGQEQHRDRERERTLPTQHQHQHPAALVSRVDSAGAVHTHAHGRRRASHGHRVRSSRTSSRPSRSSSRPPRSSRRPRDRKCSSPATRSCFGYDIEDVDGFLAKASLDNPANIPMVLACACTLYRTREGGWQEEVSLPLGMVVNGVLRASCWLYAQTPHGHEGYVRYSACLPLGILPQPRPQPHAKRTSSSCWDTASDIFPYPSLRTGNRTDSDKVKDTRSEMAYGSRRSRSGPNRRRGLHLQGLVEARRVERTVDALYLRAVTPKPQALVQAGHYDHSHAPAHRSSLADSGFL